MQASHVAGLPVQHTTFWLRPMSLDPKKSLKSKVTGAVTQLFGLPSYPIPVPKVE